MICRARVGLCRCLVGVASLMTVYVLYVTCMYGVVHFTASLPAEVYSASLPIDRMHHTASEHHEWPHNDLENPHHISS